MLSIYRGGVSVAALSAAMGMACWAAPALAQSTPPDDAKPRAEEIIVTGSRVVRDGFQAPTPTTVLGAEALQAAATVTIADTLNQLPAFTNSVTSHTTNIEGSTGQVGVNKLNLRGLGTNRTLVLLDGQRFAGSDNSGAADANIIPAGLIKRVDVVTGGASAAYGSDAIAGVVNYVLDHKFTGLKLNAEGSITTYGDDKAYNINLTGGFTFADGRGHVQAYGEIMHLDGITGRARPWEQVGTQLLANPAYGTGAGQSTSVPSLIVRDSVGLAVAAPGGLIVSGPLRGVTFGAGGSPFQLTYGSIISNLQMVGGDWQYTRVDNLTNLDVRQSAQRAVARIGFDLTDNTEIYAGLQYSRTDSYNTNGSTQYFLGNLTISATNPFLPASVRAQAANLGLTSLPFGTSNAAVSQAQPATIRTFLRYNVGADGKFAAFGTDWSWSTHFQHSVTKVNNRVFNDIIRPRLTQALDAVVDPVSGQIVCRNPANGCVPYNAFGLGVASPASVAWITGVSNGITYIRQSSAEASIQGEPFSTWAGPVSVATGVDWRRDYTDGTSSALDQARSFFFGNFAAATVSQSVKEAFFETAIPLARDAAFAKSLDLNGGVRATDYSKAGYVTTWKVGATWEPTDGIMLRGTRSRDIRAPSLGEISPALTSVAQVLLDRFRNNAVSGVLTITTGNPNLKPEIADTTGLGVVLSPAGVPGLRFSVDYYNIAIKGAISAVNQQQVIDFCYDGSVPAQCAFITRGSPLPGETLGPITSVQVSPVNNFSLKTRGIDFETAYALPLSKLSSGLNGNLALRALATHVISMKNSAASGVFEGAGVNANGAGLNYGGVFIAPKWKYLVNATLDVEPVVISLTMRGTSPGKLNSSFITCTSSCPAATPANPTVDNNHVNSWTVYDLNLTYKATIGGAAAQFYLTVENLGNKAPPKIPGQLNVGYFTGQAYQSFYSGLGRYFHGGVRVKI